MTTTQVDDAALSREIARQARPLPPDDDGAFAAAFDRWGDRRIVLLGEATHGTEEFYRARTVVTRNLIARHGFRIVAAEADWPDAATYDLYVKGKPLAGRRKPFRRFPTWMWRNAEIASLIAWMRLWNGDSPAADQAGFFGLDMYNMNDSIHAVIAHLDATDPAAAAVARERYGCLDPWAAEPAAYGGAAARGYASCEDQVVEQCRALLERSLGESGDLLDLRQNARLVAAAERYYRTMHRGGAEAWNLRDSHMFETLRNVLDAQGPDSKAIVWAHNSHVGDARATGMGVHLGEHNLGQLCRQAYGEEAVLIGFGTHAGTVVAASDWNGPMEVKHVRPSLKGSYERLCHDSAMPRFLLDLSAGTELRDMLSASRTERFIGVVYRPETELQSHYAEASLPRQFDGWVWFDETQALKPLGRDVHRQAGAADTWPFGV